MRNLLFILLAITFGCKSSYDPDEIKTEAEKMLNDYHQAMEKGGLMAEFAYLDSSDAFFWVPPGYSSAIDYDSVRAVLVKNAPAIKEIKIRWEALEVIPLTSEIATFHGTVHSEMTDSTGTTTFTCLLESGTLIRRSDGWKLLSGQTRICSQ